MVVGSNSSQLFFTVSGKLYCVALPFCCVVVVLHCLSQLASLFMPITPNIKSSILQL